MKRPTETFDVKFNLALKKLNPKPKDIIVITIKEKVNYEKYLTLKMQADSCIKKWGLKNHVLLLTPGVGITAKTVEKIKSDLDAIAN